MTFSLRFINKVRKLGLKIIKPGYIKNKLKARTGSCKKCGMCCLYCSHLKDDQCTVYDNRPWWCNKEFPIDTFEQKAFGVKNCGYKFK